MNSFSSISVPQLNLNLNDLNQLTQLSLLSNHIRKSKLMTDDFKPIGSNLESKIKIGIQSAMYYKNCIDSLSNSNAEIPKINSFKSLQYKNKSNKKLFDYSHFNKMKLKRNITLKNLKKLNSSCTNKSDLKDKLITIQCVENDEKNGKEKSLDNVNENKNKNLKKNKSQKGSNNFRNNKKYFNIYDNSNNTINNNGNNNLNLNKNKAESYTNEYETHSNNSFHSLNSAKSFNKIIKEEDEYEEDYLTNINNNINNNIIINNNNLSNISNSLDFYLNTDRIETIQNMPETTRTRTLPEKKKMIESKGKNYGSQTERLHTYINISSNNSNTNILPPITSNKDSFPSTNSTTNVSYSKFNMKNQIFKTNLNLVGNSKNISNAALSYNQNSIDTSISFLSPRGPQNLELNNMLDKIENNKQGSEKDYVNLSNTLKQNKNFSHIDLETVKDNLTLEDKIRNKYDYITEQKNLKIKIHVYYYNLSNDEMRCVKPILYNKNYNIRESYTKNNNYESLYKMRNAIKLTDEAPKREYKDTRLKFKEKFEDIKNILTDTDNYKNKLMNKFEIK